MTIRLFDNLGRPLKGCTSFEYKGQTISISNIMTDWVEVMVFFNVKEKQPKSFVTVEEAIEAINEFVK